jgi:hypothetical protein
MQAEDEILESIKQHCLNMEVDWDEVIREHENTPDNYVHTYTEEEKQMMSESLKSSEAHKKAMARIWTKERRERQAQMARETTTKRKEYDVWNKGKVGVQKCSDETREKMAQAQKGRKWWNDGQRSYFQKEPQSGWVKGRL